MPINIVFGALGKFAYLTLRAGLIGIADMSACYDILRFGFRFG